MKAGATLALDRPLSWRQIGAVADADSGLEISPAARGRMAAAH
jgi:hypothetical protein